VSHVQWADLHKDGPCCRNLLSFNHCMSTVRSRYERQLIRLNMKKKRPTRTGMEDSRSIFFCKRFSYNENALYLSEASRSRYSYRNVKRIGYIREINKGHFFPIAGGRYSGTASRRSTRKDANVLQTSVCSTSGKVLKKATTAAAFISGFIRKPLICFKISH